MLDLIRQFKGPAEAIVDGASGARWSYGELLDRVEVAGEDLARRRPGTLVFLLADATVDFITLYLACLRASMPVLLVDPRAPLEALLETYRPALVLAPEAMTFEGFREPEPLGAAPSFRAWSRTGSYPLHPDLALLLPTSGSTGSPKLVRLKAGNIRSNAQSIAAYLGLGPGERALQSLPMFYSYGLSVLNSHLAAGGTLVLTPDSFLRPEFWATFDREACTSFAGIPYMYETLHRLRFDPARHPSLRTLTQAGGGLKPALIAHFHDAAARAGQRFVVMYGQTEATARISYVPPERLAGKIGTIGIPIPGGTLTLREVAGVEEGREMVYTGPNVMLGYAERVEDLALGDELDGVLPTGDLAVQDEDGFFRIVGRLNRFAKLFGKRVSLEDVERTLEHEFGAACAVLESPGGLRVFLEAGEPEAVALFAARHLAVPPRAVEVRILEALPRTGNGKKNYAALGALAC